MDDISVTTRLSKAARTATAGIAQALGGLRDLTPLWVWGLIVLQIHLARRWLGLEGESYEWAQYILLGTLFPVLLLALGIAGRRGRWPAVGVGSLRILLAVLGIAGAAAFVVRNVGAAVLAIALAHGLIAAAVVAIRCRHDSRTGLLAIRWKWGGIREALADLPGIAVGLLVIVASWLVALKFAWWSPFVAWISGSVFAFVVFAAALLLVALNVRGDAGERGRRTRFGSVVDALALVVIAAASLRFDTFGGTTAVYDERSIYMAFHHTGAIIGPAELVRQGGWLLWDVPSQYGFLSALAIALLPVKSAWQSFYILHAILLFLSATLIYALLRSLRPGAANFLFALGLTLAAMFVLPGWPEQWPGIVITPAVGPYRFFWCYALLGVLAWAYRAAAERRAQARVLGAGCVTWLLGSLWSAESAVYCSTIWLPSYVLLVARWSRSPGPSPLPVGRWTGVAAWLALPAALLAMAVGAITAYYLAVLGHPPDWYAYVEYCLAKYFAMNADLNGTVLVPLLVFAAIACCGVPYLGRGDALGPLSLISGTGAFLWSSFSYFVGRSHEVITTDLSHVLVAAIAATLHLLARERRNDRPAALIRAALVPVLTVLLTAAFGSKAADLNYLATLKRGYVRRIDRRVPLLERPLALLMAEAQIGRDDPVAFVDSNHPRARRGHDGEGPLTTYNTWLPMAPCAFYLPLSEERRRVYFARFVARSRSDGWLVQSKDGVDPCGSSYPWILEEISRTHAPVATLEEEHWRLTRFVLKDRLDRGTAPARRAGARSIDEATRR